MTRRYIRIYFSFRPLQILLFFSRTLYPRSRANKNKNYERGEIERGDTRRRLALKNRRSSRLLYLSV